MNQDPPVDVNICEASKIPYPLPDSTRGYWRAWCSTCKEPLRVSQENIHRPVCDDCSDIKTIAPYKFGLTSRQASALSKLSGRDQNH